MQAVTKQAESAIHVSNFFTSEPAIALAERLLVDRGGARAGPGVFFANSGTEATEAAIKLSRRTGRTRIVALEGSFHGRSTGALALTHKAAYREPFEPLIPEVVFVPPNDADALRGGGRRHDGGRSSSSRSRARPACASCRPTTCVWPAS